MNPFYCIGSILVLFMFIALVTGIILAEANGQKVGKK